MKTCVPGDPDGVFTSTADGMTDIAWQMMGSPLDNVWGAEHMAPLVSIAKQTAGPCTYMEVGAHVGWLVLLAAQLGCKVFAWEAGRGCAQRVSDNLRLNKIPTTKARVFSKEVGSQKGGRMQDDMPTDTRITLLKMDIDGPDSDAMIGMDRLFKARQVLYVNAEYSWKQSGRDPRYLDAMDARGFDVYLLDCYGDDSRTNETRISLASGGRASCLNRQADMPLGPAWRHNRVHWAKHHTPGALVDVPMLPAERRFLRCLTTSTPSSARTQHCARVVQAQQIHREEFDAFTQALRGGGEVDLILQLRHGVQGSAQEAAAQSRVTTAAHDQQQPQYELLAVLLESITVAAARAGHEKHLKDRTWAGKSHIGTRPKQYQEYYSIAREVRPQTICEIGMNAGHSTAVFLSAAGRDARLVMFDLGTFSYSQSAMSLLRELFPEQIEFHIGDSRVTLPVYLARQRQAGRPRPCDLFSVDGDHSYAGVKADLLTAIEATRAGGVIVLDDMKAGLGPRRAFEEHRATGLFSKVRCTENEEFRIPSIHRYDTTKMREQTMSWCFAWVAQSTTGTKEPSSSAPGSLFSRLFGRR
jgi:predicted O-methyltransferase YrrM